MESKSLKYGCIHCRRRCLFVYVVSRVFLFHKGTIDSVIDQYQKPPVMLHFPGFVRRDVLINKKNPDYDSVRILIYWENKNAFYRFEGSPLHIALHKDKNSSHHQKPEGFISMVEEDYILISSDTYVES